MSAKNIVILLITLGIIGMLLYFFLSFPSLGEPKNTPQPSQGSFVNDKESSPSAELKIEDLVVGNGQEVKKGDTVVMNYLGTLTNGTKFDSSYDRNQPFTTQIGVGQVIKGWDEGVPGMKVGGKRKLTIPPSMAYGSQQVGSIPPNSTLIFEVELLSIK